MAVPATPGDPPPEPAAGIPVLLSPGMAELAPGLAQILATDFDVATEHASPSRVLVTGPVGPVGVASLRASYPRTGLLVVDQRWSSRRPGEAVIMLDAGGDGRLAGLGPERPQTESGEAMIKIMLPWAATWPST